MLTGVPRTEGDELVIGDDHGKEVRAQAPDVEALHPSALSIMPEGLEKAVGPERMRDLLTFLLTEPLSRPRWSATGRRRLANERRWTPR